METFSFAVRLWHDNPSLYAKKVVSTKQSHDLPPGTNVNSSRHVIGLLPLLYLKTLPSAHSYDFPFSTIGLSQLHMSSMNSLSAALLGSSLVNS